ncbi:MAG: NAD(P)/FAD-dependent oxidoreductase [Anaerolineae bacterium]|nr:NAD(P)/FAD-dependent oxidoreductase [Anaerolineae bacterium]
MSGKKDIVIIGSSFAGLTAAFDVKRLIGDRTEVTVITKSPLFTFIPSLIWYTQGWRQQQDITFALEPAYQKRGIKTVVAEAIAISPEQGIVHTTKSNVPFDYLIIATGPYWNFEAITGLGPHHGHTQSICNLEHAQSSRQAWIEYLKNPGPVVVGAAQGASCFGAAYEFVLNIEQALRREGLRQQASVSFFTSEPFAGHFGLGGVGKSKQLLPKFFAQRGIEYKENIAIESITEDTIHFNDGSKLPFKYAMIIPPFKGTEVVRNSPGVGNTMGWVEVEGTYRHKTYPNIYAAGVAVAVAPPQQTPIPTGVPKTGYMSEVMGRTAAHNIAADIKNEKPVLLPPTELPALCMLDAAKGGILMSVDKLYPDKRKREILLPSYAIHAGKIAFEKYFLWKCRTGRTNLP